MAGSEREGEKMQRSRQLKFVALSRGCIVDFSDNSLPSLFEKKEFENVDAACDDN
ncbi:hypothetical protein PROFUN_01718 [Planoprotostelium fungivorum]|uniref:Uncharacterized protein n=1 Tax=Planoprotostelium fungivorum TaxID=1890364 RepID=A0A2P6MWB8_9EUKA|nr:hypothetical protein PROFUN_01718 [Planoprotostelium fungivorum]